MAATASSSDVTESRALDGVLVLGAGLAGLSAALAAGPGPVWVISAGPLGTACSSRRGRAWSCRTARPC